MLEWTNEDERKLTEAQKKVRRLLDKKKAEERISQMSEDAVIFVSSGKSKLKSQF